MADAIQLRFRHTTGDLGPYTFQENVTIQQIKDKLLSEWPKEGPLAKEPPGQAADLKLIISGKFVDAAKSLRDYKKDMGEIKPDTVVTMHIIVRPSTVPTKAPGPQPQEKEAQKCCGCVIS